MLHRIGAASILSDAFECASWVINSVAALAALHWTHWGLRCCCVLILDVFDDANANGMDLDLL
jgi:hypothetical protein